MVSEPGGIVYDTNAAETPIVIVCTMARELTISVLTAIYLYKETSPMRSESWTDL